MLVVVRKEGFEIKISSSTVTIPIDILIIPEAVCLNLLSWRFLVQFLNFVKKVWVQRVEVEMLLPSDWLIT